MSYDAEDAERDLELMKRDPGYGAALDERLIMWLVQKEIEREKKSVYIKIKDDVMAAITDKDLIKVSESIGMFDWKPEPMTFKEGYSPKG